MSWDAVVVARTLRVRNAEAEQTARFGAAPTHQDA